MIEERESVAAAVAYVHNTTCRKLTSRQERIVEKVSLKFSLLPRVSQFKISPHNSPYKFNLGENI